MVLATALFLLLLAVLHVGEPDAIDRPLSLFREYHPVRGYALFGLLALVSGLHLRTYYKLGRSLLAPGASLALLAVVSLTPSPAIGHTLAAFVLLGFVFGWYAIRLYSVSSPWLLVHLVVPFLLANAGSYGLWQKLTIVYLLLAANIDCLIATERLSLPGPDTFARRHRSNARRRYAPKVLWKRYDQPSQEPKKPTGHTATDSRKGKG